jgi:hypothetical protein
MTFVFIIVIVCNDFVTNGVPGVTRLVNEVKVPPVML